jgi:arsenical pump membrane protein
VVYVIAGLAIALLGIRPRHIPEWIWPVAGAAIVIALGLEPARNAFVAIAAQWNVLLFILGLMGLAAAAEESGAFAWITNLALQRAGGSRRRLFVLLFVAGAVVTIFLSNDATAIVFTPIVYRAVAKRGGDVMPYLFGCTFVADTASFGLPFSNPANVLILPHARLLPYLWHLGPPEIAAIVVNLLLFLAFFNRQLGGRYELDELAQPPASAVRALVAMAFVAVGYFAAIGLAWPIGPVAVVGAVVTWIVAGVRPGHAVRHIGWKIFALLAGLFALLDAVARAGFVDWALRGLDDALRHGWFAAAAIATTAAALLSNFLNNLPVAVASSYVVARMPTEHFAYPLILGVDLGPNLATTGSLATLMWLATLRDRGIRVNPLEYLRLGIAVVPLTVGVGLLWLWFVR